MQIVYVEDNMVNLSLVRRIAQMGNHEVISYTNGADALEALKAEHADLILMDIELEGELDGVEVVKRLRARGDKRPIVALTAYAMVGDKERILEAGCDDYLPKPLPITQFLTILARFDPKNIQPEEPAEAEDEKFLGGKSLQVEPESKSAPAETTTTPEAKVQQSSSDIAKPSDTPIETTAEKPAEVSMATPLAELPDVTNKSEGLHPLQPEPPTLTISEKVEPSSEDPSTLTPSAKTAEPSSTVSDDKTDTSVASDSVLVEEKPPSSDEATPVVSVGMEANEKKD